MTINIYELIEGAKKAEGLTVIIDVFRAFSLECYMFDKGAREIHPIGRLDEAFRLKNDHPDWLLFAERGGAKVDGCDGGNSPSSIKDMDLTGKTIIHSTGAGTQGIVNAVNADEIITGSLVNAAAVAGYISRRNPETVSIVAMGQAGVKTAREDVVCAEYIKSLLTGEDIGIAGLVASLRNDGGEHFFDPDKQHIFPSEDFYMCAKTDVFPFVIKVESDADGLLTNRMLKPEEWT